MSFFFHVSYFQVIWIYRATTVHNLQYPPEISFLRKAAQLRLGSCETATRAISRRQFSPVLWPLPLTSHYSLSYFYSGPSLFTAPLIPMSIFVLAFIISIVLVLPAQSHRRDAIRIASEAVGGNAERRRNGHRVGENCLQLMTTFREVS